MPNSNQSTYRLECVDRTGKSVSPLAGALLTKARWQLNGPGQIVYTMPQTSRHILAPQENINEVQLWIGKNGAPESLEHWAFHSQAKEQPSLVEFSCPGLLGYFNYRFITNTSLSYGIDANHNPVGTGVEQMAIAADVVTKMQVGAKNFNIGIYPYTSSGKNRYRFYDIMQHQNVLTDILSEFPTLADALGARTGFDFDIDVVSQPGNRLFRMYYPQKGVVLTNLTLEWGRNITDYTVTVDGTKQETEVYFTGGSNGEIKFENHAAVTDPTILNTYGVWQAVKSQATEKDVNTLLALCNLDLAKFSKPPKTPEIQAVEIPDSLLGVVRTGDYIRIVIKNGRTNVDGYYRVYYIEWLPGPGNLKIGLAEL